MATTPCDQRACFSSFSVRVENGAHLIRGAGGAVDPSQQELLDQMLSFPVGKHDPGAPGARPHSKPRFCLMRARRAKSAERRLITGASTNSSMVEFTPSL